jgi:hypothetical protein
MSRIFLLSPAHCGGKRAKQVLSPKAAFPLASQLRSKEGARLGDIFSFVSGLYFRGKLTYARRYAASDNPAVSGVHIITANAGLREPDTFITRAALVAFAGGEVDPSNPRYRRPLEQSARVLAAEIGPECEVVLLGSVASPKYVDVLGRIFGEQLRFPVDFIGRGDMSRGGLLLRKVREGVELEYAPVAGAVLHGSRPPRLPPQIAGLQNCRIAERI